MRSVQKKNSVKNKVYLCGICSDACTDYLREASSVGAVLQISVDSGYPTKCTVATTEGCCYFGAFFFSGWQL